MTDQEYIRVLESALRPFAMFSANAGQGSDGKRDVVEYDDLSTTDRILKASDFDRAYEVLVEGRNGVAAFQEGMMATPKEIIAEIMDRIVDRPGHNMLASEIIKKLDAAGFAIVPKEPTDDMVRAAHSSTAGWLGLPGPHTALSQALFKHAHRYRAMINAATTAPATPT